jgi:L-aspartate oxidase
MAAAARFMAVAAFRREESRGGHYRTDFPESAPEARHSELTFPQAREASAAIMETEGDGADE